MGYERAKWQVDLSTYMGMSSTFILSGNVHDAQFGYDAASGLTYTVSLNQLLYKYLTQELGYSLVVFYNRVDGFHNPSADSMVDEFLEPVVRDPAAKRMGLLSEDPRTGKLRGTTFATASQIMRDALTRQRRPVAIVFDAATTAIEAPDHLVDAEREPLTRLFLASRELHLCRDPRSGARLANTLFLVADKVNDIPSWFYLANPYVKTLAIGKPTRGQRLAYIRQRREVFYDLAAQPAEEQEKFLNDVGNLTEGFCAAELKGFLDLCMRGQGTSTEGLKKALDTFRYGMVESYWDSLGPNAIGRARQILRARVKGQDRAVEKALDILYRAASGLSLSASAGSTKPKGVLFLAGPTGTGKTELAKALTQAIFSDESQMIRFDMSEFGERQSDQRLFGAPPGYVGYESGGELTNAVREKPFSLLLFDEIEKAHPSILDKFLQILDDGRLTDSHGETIYFGETVIVFTSNLGMTEQNPFTGENTSIIRPNTYANPEDFHRAVIEGIRRACRPEFINRIGENFVVFDFISPQLTHAIARSKLAAFARRLLAEHKIDLGMTWEFWKGLCASIEAASDMGGRGVVNALEERVLNPLSKTLVTGCDLVGERYIQSAYAGSDPDLAGTLVLAPRTTVEVNGFLLRDEEARP